MSKKYVVDEGLSWEERYRQLEAHHIEETAELINKLASYRAFEKRMIETIERDGHMTFVLPFGKKE